MDLKYLVECKVRHVSSGSLGGRDDGYVTFDDHTFVVDGAAALDRILLREDTEVLAIHSIDQMSLIASTKIDIQTLTVTAKLKKLQVDEREILRNLELKKARLEKEIATRKGRV